MKSHLRRNMSPLAALSGQRHSCPIFNNLLLTLIRLDRAFTWKWTRSELLLNASIFNILNRHNIYQYFYEDGKWKSLSILPIMPSLRVQFSF